MLSSNFIAITFRLINFFIVISVFIYLFIKHLKDIKFNVLKLKNYFSSLNKKSEELDKITKNLDFEISYQQHLSKELLEKINKWKEAYKKDLNEKKIEKESVNKKIDEKLKIQEDLLTRNKLKQEILKKVISKARSDLIEEFQNNENNITDFNAELINFLDRS